MKKKALRTTEILDNDALEAVLGQLETTTITTPEQPEEYCTTCCSGVHSTTLDGRNTCLLGN